MTIGHIRCGTVLNAVISTILGSTRIIRTSSGRLVKSTLVIIELMQTLLPEPVVPAISRCGIEVKSATSASPDESLPKNSGIAIFVCLLPANCIRSLIRTFSFSLFGTSIPMVCLPGSGATTRIAPTARARAISLDNAEIWLTLTPAAKFQFEHCHDRAGVGGDDFCVDIEFG